MKVALEPMGNPPAQHLEDPDVPFHLLSANIASSIFSLHVKGKPGVQLSPRDISALGTPQINDPSIPFSHPLGGLRQFRALK